MVQDYDRGWMLRRPSEARTDTGALFGRTMGLVAVTVWLFALGAYLARNLPGGWAMALWIASFVCLLAPECHRPSVRAAHAGVAVRLWLLVGLATAPAIFGYAHCATRRDHSAPAGVLWWALIALIAFGVVLILVSIPGGSVTDALVGSVIFALQFFLSVFGRRRR